jgi:hypothetical protein
MNMKPSHKPKALKRQNIASDLLFSLVPPQLPMMIPLPLMIGKESPAQGTYLMLALMESDGASSQNNTMSVAIITDEEDEVLLVEVGWEEESFYLDKGYEPEEARMLKFGLLVDKNEEIEFASEVFEHFRKMMAENPIFTDYVKEQHRKFSIAGTKAYDKIINKTMRKLDSMERMFKI